MTPNAARPEEAPEPARLELPDELADAAAERLFAASAPERSAVLAALLEAHPRFAGALRRLDAELAGADRLLGDLYPDAAPHATTEIGGYRILRPLGEGAFGNVFLCAQEQPIARQVAVKVLRPGAGDQTTLRRFAAERQLLAALSDPTIARVFDAGVLADGRPFFVMEFIDGAPIRTYCEDRHLACRDRLRLFVALCRGVAHAHKRGIVHRDLKPANVLVVDTESGPLPKIIDFGIAKASSPAPGDGTPRTDAGRVLGTPGYMSPEQASGQVDDVDERADVFALGVMLYELLTGELPWARGAAATDTEPPRPSARVTTTTGTAGAATPAQRRQLAAELRGDLDWITLRALARDRGDRYATASALADDLERHLQGRPVSVGRPSVAYRLRKFVRRNRATALVGGGALLVALIASIGVVAFGRAADAAIADARHSAATSSADATAAVAKLLERGNDPRLREAPRGDAMRQALLQDAMALYDRFLRDRPADPELRTGRCRALLGIAQVHWLLGEAALAGTAAGEAAGEAERVLAGAADDLAWRALRGEALFWQGSALALVANRAAAQAQFAAAAQQLAPCAAAEPAKHWRMHVAARRAAARQLEPKLVEQEIAELRAVLAILHGLRDADPQLDGLAEELVETSCALGGPLRALRRHEEAREVLAEAEAELPRVRVDGQGLAVRVYQHLANIAWDVHTSDPQRLGERHRAAIGHAQKAVDAALAWHTAHPDRLQPRASLADALGGLAFKQNYSGEFAAASASYRRQLEQLEELAQRFPDAGRSITLCRTLAEFALVLSDRFRQDDLAEASACAARALAIDERIPPEAQIARMPRWHLLHVQAVLESARWQGDADGAWRALEPLVPREPEGLQSRHLDALAGAWLGLSRWHFEQGRVEAAGGWRTRTRALLTEDPRRLGVRAVELGWLDARAAAAVGDHAAAAAAADGIRAARKSWLADRRAADCLHLAWRCARTAGESEQDPGTGYRTRASALYDDVIQALEKEVTDNPDDPWFVLPWGFANVRRAECAAAAGDPERARALLASVLPRLEAIRATAHADQWDEAAMRDGRALFER